MNTSLKALIVASGLAVSLASAPAYAAVDVEKKIGQFGSPIEWRLECVKWASGDWPWPMHGGWKTCVGHAYQNLQHEFFLVAKGPDADQAARQVLQEALGAAVVAAIGTGLLTPSPEPLARVTAALAAAKTAFLAYLSTRGFERLADQYDIRVDHRTHW
jgi:hypothetical protein